MIRRRRECLQCQRRFTTYERIEETLPLIIKKNGARQPFDRGKLISGIEKACHKRPVSAEDRDELVEEVVRAVMGVGEKEVPVAFVGEAIMRGLQKLDDVAYVRFASVYREFRDIRQFKDELDKLISNGKQ